MPVPLTTHHQDSAYSSPWTFGMKVRMQIWAYAWALLCEWTPKPFNPWRLLVLRAFGARIDGRPFVHQRMRVHIPWNLILHDRATVGDRANMYNMAEVEIGARAIVAQETYLCTGTHDFDDPHLPLQTAPIRIGEDAFVSARVFVMPGITVGARSIVGAASVVTRDVPPDVLAAGNPCRVIRPKSRAVAA